MEKIKKEWLDYFLSEKQTTGWWQKKRSLCKERDAEIIRIHGDGRLYKEFFFDNNRVYHYLVHLSYLIKQDDFFYLEEEITPYEFRYHDGEITNHYPIHYEQPENPSILPEEIRGDEVSLERFTYDRNQAVRYAERWWNSYNPAYKKFDVDCTNYVSQCLYAGGAPMRGAPSRETGWWYQNDNWSFSWAVAHSLRWYLSGSTQGLQGTEVDDASELLPGDIICYDFQGDGRWDHNTIVVTKDAYGMPLVNAHTNNSRNRYWSYEDSAAWTPDIKYKFFRIGDK
ncbi:amidase domain-containing protein [Virgibacillus sp. SK37]|uniref:amidase domain-containing protein n=1 Tax=Virgibacillus sp. SK37 TaxID=403957 RepID=UPI0004D0F880|nr:amidase domain-containing protein [Virgibacillus sp. SK37]AIF42653.1 hypothetical protein X953_04830 [Virgibacillus sp. SK37]